MLPGSRWQQPAAVSSRKAGTGRRLGVGFTGTFPVWSLRLCLGFLQGNPLSPQLRLLPVAAVSSCLGWLYS